MKQELSVKYIPFIVGPIVLCGHREFHGLQKIHRYPPALIGIFGSEPRRSILMKI
jgi:hypothetical protein